MAALTRCSQSAGARARTGSARAAPAASAAPRPLPRASLLAGWAMPMLIGAPLRQPSLAMTRARAARSSRMVVSSSAGWSSVDVEEGKRLLDQEGYMFLDLRTEKEYDDEHLTKPPRTTINVPLGPGLTAGVSAKVTNKGARLLVACADGDASRAAMDELVSSGFTGLVHVEGGYNGWTEVFSTSGRRKPPKGRWVPTGQEALKSGLPVGAADTYEEGGSKDGVRFLP